MRLNRSEPKVSDALKDAEFIREAMEAFDKATPEARAKAIAFLRAAVEARL